MKKAILQLFNSSVNELSAVLNNSTIIILNCKYNLTYTRAEIICYVPVSGDDPVEFVRDKNPPVYQLGQIIFFTGKRPSYRNIS